jgi:putative tryptophan/tyrosine transport system substrate-binding protein
MPALLQLSRDPIITLAARLPAVYYERNFVVAGGLISYESDFVDQHRQAAGYSIASSRARNPPTCRCRRPPNMTGDQSQARALGLEVPPTLLATRRRVNRLT